MAGQQRADREGVHAIRLKLAAALRVTGDLVVLVERVGGLAGQVAKRRLKRLHREVRQQRLDVLIAAEKYHHSLSFLMKPPMSALTSW